MRKMLTGLGFALTGILADGFMLLAGAFHARNYGPPVLPLWNALFRPGLQSSLIGLNLEIPFVCFSLLLALGIAVTVAELFRRKPEPPRNPRGALAGLIFSLTGTIADGIILLTIVLYHAQHLDGRSAVWSLLMETPADGVLARHFLGVPFLIFAALLLWGLALLFAELFRRGLPASPPSSREPEKGEG